MIFRPNIYDAFMNIFSNFRKTGTRSQTVPYQYRTKLKIFLKNSLGTFDLPYYRTIIKNLKLILKTRVFKNNSKFFIVVRWFDSTLRTVVLL